MISEPEMAGEPGASVAPADVVSTADGTRTGFGTGFGTRDRRPWTWALGAAALTSALWGLGLHAADSGGHTSAPDQHGYRLNASPCAGSDLKPLTDAFGAKDFFAGPADIRTGPTLDQTRCLLTTPATIRAGWTSAYAVTVTVELHKKTDPAPEFRDRSRPNGPNLQLPYAVSGPAETDRVTAVPGLGDRAFLLTGNDSRQSLTVLHGGAVFTVDLAADQRWVGGDEVPQDVNGLPGNPPSLARFHPAMTATVRRLMDVLSDDEEVAREK